MAKHAFLSASASHRWINCPPSAKLCEGIKDESSHYAQEGTDCHELCAYLVEMALGRDVEDPTENLTYYSGEMQNCAEEYRDYVLEQFERSKKFCSDPMVFIEQRLDFSRWVENGFGTGDCVIIADEVLHIIDYKHGLDVLLTTTAVLPSSFLVRLFFTYSTIPPAIATTMHAPIITYSIYRNTSYRLFIKGFAIFANYRIL